MREESDRAFVKRIEKLYLLSVGKGVKKMSKKTTKKKKKAKAKKK